MVLAGESYDESVARELTEELGLHDTRLEFLFTHYYEDEDNKVWGGVYRCLHEGPFMLQKEEVEYGKFVSPEEVLNTNREAPFTPDGIEILRRALVLSRP